jgi:hypothetical protein
MLGLLAANLRQLQYSDPCTGDCARPSRTGRTIPLRPRTRRYQRSPRLRGTEHHATERYAGGNTYAGGAASQAKAAEASAGEISAREDAKGWRGIKIC